MPYCTCPNCGTYFQYDTPQTSGAHAVAFEKANKLFKLCADYFRIPVHTLRGPGKKGYLVAAKHITRYLIHRNCNMTLDDIGKLWYPVVHHTTVLHSLRIVENALDTKKYVYEDLMKLTAILKYESATIEPAPLKKAI